MTHPGKRPYRYIPAILGVGTILFFSWIMLQITLPFYSFRHDVGFLLSKQRWLHLGYWRLAFYVHITASLPVFLLGAVQLLQRIRHRYPLFHRKAGKIYVGIILFLSAPSGLVLGYYANGGRFAQLSFCLLALLWWFFTWKAYREIRLGNIQAHKDFMIRSYALTLSALALRSYVYLLPLVSDIRGSEMYILVAWMSWVPQYLVLEIYFFYRNRNTLRAQALPAPGRFPHR